MIDEIELQELRRGMEIQFRYKFYKDPKFPFLQSIGIKHVLQGFEHPHEDVGYLGMLHLWWVSDPTGTVLGIWESEWLDTPQEGVALAQTLDANRIYDVQTHALTIQNIAEQEVMKQLQEKIRKEEEEESKTVLWN